MKEKQDIRRFEIGMVQLIVVAFVAWGVSKIPYSEIGKEYSTISCNSYVDILFK